MTNTEFGAKMLVLGQSANIRQFILDALRAGQPLCEAAQGFVEAHRQIQDRISPCGPTAAKFFREYDALNNAKENADSK